MLSHVVRGFRSIAPLGVAAAWVVVASCQRTPEEPPARPLAAESAAAVTPRCIRATPFTATPAAAPGPAAGCPSDPEKGRTGAPIVALTFPESPAVHIDAELVRTPVETERGLMYRKSMPENRGMLFRLGERRDHTFWMRNTCIPLDMLFIEDDGLIVGVLENVPTLNDDPRSVGCPSSWVLEMNAGWARKNGVRAGQKLAIPASAR